MSAWPRIAIGKREFVIDDLPSIQYGGITESASDLPCKRAIQLAVIFQS